MIDLYREGLGNILDDNARTVVDLVHRRIIHPLLTSGEARQDREIAHERALRLAEVVQANPVAMELMSRAFVYKDPILKLTVGNMESPNPIWFPAGFDKDARIHKFLGKAAGFGAVTEGTVTWLAYGGNQRPRIFDLPANEGLINRMGFPGEGGDKVAARLEESDEPRDYGLIVSFGASKPSFERGTVVEDYGRIYNQMLPYGEGHEDNCSSPNTVGVRSQAEPEVLEEHMSHIEEVRNASPYRDKLLGVKFSGDMPMAQLIQDVGIVKDHGGDFVTLINTSTDQALRESLLSDVHKNEPGGMSGAFLNRRALEITHRVYEEFGESIIIVRAGGVRGRGEDLWEALTYGGATAAEPFSSYVRPTTSTPNFTFYALRDLARAMRACGMQSMADFKELRGKRVPYPLAK
jgi:dihydroorotate dehydrogenase